MKPVPAYLGAAAALVVLVVALRLLLPDRARTPEASPDRGIELTEHNRRPNRPSELRRLPEERKRPNTVRSAAKDSPSTAPASRPRRELTGYLVDDFRSWTSLPTGYRAQNITVANGGVRIASPAGPEQTVAGTLLSPPLPLRPPPGGRPDTPGRELPPGSSLQLEIRLSRDGSDWTDWNLIERHTAPDGPLAPLPPQSDPAALEAYQDASTTGPTIQYRLTLTTGSGGSPTLRDLRIWHEGPARLEEELSLHTQAP